MSSKNIARQRLMQASHAPLPESSDKISPAGVADQPSAGMISMAPTGHGQPAAPRKGSQSPERQQQQHEGAVAVPSKSAGPVVLSALGQAARTGWSALQLCHRYLIAPAAVWALRTLKEYMDEQIAIARAMSRPCPLPQFSEAELMSATGQLGPAARLLDSPYGLVSYTAELRGQRVVVRQTHLGKLADVDAFWTEAAAGRAALAAGSHPHVVSYIGCCPSLACHIYQRPSSTTTTSSGPIGAPTRNNTRASTSTSTPSRCCSLREALAPGGPHSGSLLGSWEVRLALCEQLAGAGAHLLRAGITASDISSAHVLIQLHGEQTARGGPTSTTTTSSGGGGAVPHCWLAPGCGFQAQPQQLQQAQQRSQQQGVGSLVGVGGEEAGRVADMAFGLGQLLMQVFGPPDTPTPAPETMLQALSDLTPTHLLSPAVAPPLTDDQVWPLLAALYPLLAWGQGSATLPPATGGRRGGPSGSAAIGGAHPRSAPSATPGSCPQGGGAAAGGPVANRSQGGQGPQGQGGQGQGLEPRLALQSHLLHEVVPALVELRQQLQEQAAAVAASASAAGRRTTAGAGAGGTRPEEGGAFEGASAPPMPTPGRGISYPPTQTSPAPVHAMQGVGVGGGGGGVGSGTARLGEKASGPAVPPDELCCPITHELMDDPVVAADGHSYERAAIAQWFAGRPGRPTSPLTGAVLPGTALTPNYALRKIIQDWRAQHA